MRESRFDNQTLEDDMMGLAAVLCQFGFIYEKQLVAPENLL